eukprot:TRINITY_DN154_c2_g2_i1.p1 TRINITY_DN154_c2_g2~~TRINITY_DN154_c2_g2_i1.p1  ORF type:complete len:527 (+),score=81.87 TRINITY_DN154_c2_g2_i1:110-1690(+)
MASSLKFACWAISAAASLARLLSQDAINVSSTAFAVDDQCWLGAGHEACSLAALQMRSVLDAAEDPVQDSAQDPAQDLRAAGPPPHALAYKGMAWPMMIINRTQEMHVFAIGDWGGLDGSLIRPLDRRQRMMLYPGGDKAGPHVFPKVRWNQNHTRVLCSFSQFIACFGGLRLRQAFFPRVKWKTSFSRKSVCVPSCGFVPKVDSQPQQLVAQAFISRAADKDPSYILNVGDNFYWGGLAQQCGYPMDNLTYVAKHQFQQVFEKVYRGPGVDGKPWLSVLGNHDWGGFRFENGWDQEIAYTWHSDRWVMPAPYFSQHVKYVRQNFSVDIFMLDSNVMAAHEPFQTPLHNICSSLHNNPGSSCASAGGPPSVEACRNWFQELWQEQRVWLEQKLYISSADWQLVVTHYPCGHEASWYTKLHQQYGLDLLVTGHRHDQELYEYSKELGGLTCFVTGGGGGITSEASPDPEKSHDWHGEAQYGFYDLTMTKHYIHIASINWNSTVMKAATVYPTSANVTRGFHDTEAPN